MVRVPATAPLHPMQRTPTGATTCCSTNTSMATPGGGWGRAIRLDGLHSWPRSSTNIVRSTAARPRRESTDDAQVTRRLRERLIERGPSEQLVERHWQTPDPLSRCVVDRIGNGRRDAH